MGKAKTTRKKRKRKRSKKARGDVSGSVKKGARAGGGVMQGLRSSFKRAAGGGSDRPGDEPSTLSNVLWTLLLLGAVGFLLYRWYG